VIQYEKAYKDYRESTGLDEIEYFAMYSWASKFNIQCIIMVYPEGFCYELDYDEGRISGPPRSNIIDSIEDVAETIFGLIETYLEPHGIFDDLSNLRDAAEINLKEGESPEALINPMIREAMESWSKMLSFNPGSRQFKDNFLEACIYISSLISIMENYEEKTKKSNRSDGQEKV
jgi:hypothetical protein